VEDFSDHSESFSIIFAPARTTEAGRRGAIISGVISFKRRTFGNREEKGKEGKNFFKVAS
jgi:hypothetical protein